LRLVRDAMNRAFIAVVALVTMATSTGGKARSDTQKQSQDSFHPGYEAPKTGSATRDYVGDSACQSCHKEQSEAFHGTAHFLTSRLPEAASILGKFTVDANVMKTSNPDLFFRMEQKGGDFFETAVEGVAPFTTERSERIAFVIGSGGKGQTYLYWKGDDLFELPVSYWNELGWVNSPGYRDGAADFRRPVIPRCLECHATYFESMASPPNRYSKSGFVLGITCEKCHGAGREHVARVATKVVNWGILNPAKFSRQRKMDLCTWCHAGAGIGLKPEFSYIPGSELNNYLELAQPNANAPVDVHGSQVELLGRSRCYQKSEMTCVTCHNVHEVQHDLADFSKKCLSCHKPDSTMFPKQGHQVLSNCIDCHMPRQKTQLIVFDQNGKRSEPEVRSHWIAVYGEGRKK
jgi:Cytochrome c554 and c-prime